MKQDWIYIDKNDINTYPKNNQDILAWDDYKGYVVCTYYEGSFEDKYGNILEHILGWIPIPAPIESKLKFISRV